MCKLEIAQKFHERVNGDNFSNEAIEELLESDFFPLVKEKKTAYLYDLFNGLMLYDLKPEIIVSLYRALMKLDSYRREEVSVARLSGSTVLECAGSGKKPYKTLNISTPSIITAVASGARIIKKGSSTTSSIIGSADLLYCLGLREEIGDENMLKLLQNTGFTFVNIEKVVPCFNSVYNGHFYKPHILSYILAADVTSLRGDKIVYGLSGFDVMKCCKCLVFNNSCGDITVYSSTENEVDYFDELIGNGTCYVARKKRKHSHPTISQYALNTPSPKLLPAAFTKKESINAVVDLLKSHENKSYCDAVCCNAGFYLSESGVVNDILEGKELAMESLLSGRSYKKLVEIIKCSGGRPTWNE